MSHTASHTSDRIDLTVTELAGCVVEFSVTAKAPLVNEALDRALKEVRKNISIPGFRKGKVPVEQVMKNFGDRIDAEARDHVVQKGFSEAVAMTGIFPWSSETIKTPGVESLTKDEETTVTYTFERTPEIPLIEPEMVKVTPVEPEAVTDEDLEKHLDELRKAYADYVDADEAAEGDRVIAKVSSEGEILGENEPISLDREQSPEWLVDPLIGVKKGDQIEATPPAEGAKLLQVEVIEVKRPEAPSDDALAERLKMESFDKLKEQATKRLEQEKGSKAREETLEKLWIFLFEQFPFPLPTSLVEEERKSRVQRLVQKLKGQNLSKEEMIDREKEIEMAAANEAEHALRTLFLSRHVCDQARIEISHKESLERARQMLMWQQMMSGQQISMPSDKDLEPYVDQVRLQLIKEKAEEYLLGQENPA